MSQLEEDNHLSVLVIERRNGIMCVCLKCGRSFKNTNQSHFCGEKPKTIDEYISAQDEEKQVHLVKVRRVIDSFQDLIYHRLYLNKNQKKFQYSNNHPQNYIIYYYIS